VAAFEELLQEHGVWRGQGFAVAEETLPSGYAALDRELPGGGWPAGALTEILAGREGIGELSLLMPALARVSNSGKRIVWLAPPHVPYAPALAAAGIDLTQLAVISAPGRHEALWAAEQVLRSGACHALVAWFRNARYAELRRLGVAAAASSACAVLVRPREALRESSPACLRLELDAAAGALLIHIVKRRGAPCAAPLTLPLKRPVHALGRAPFREPAAAGARAHRRVGLPVHA
jgi:protein ImuA